MNDTLRRILDWKIDRFTVRPADVNEFLQCAQWQYEVYSAVDPMLPPMEALPMLVGSFYDDNSYLFALDDGTELVGMLSCELTRGAPWQNGWTLIVRCAYIKPEARCIQAIAALMQAVERLANYNEAERINVVTSSARELGIYRDMGFKPLFTVSSLRVKEDG
jgi:hypothetical protein